MTMPASIQNCPGKSRIRVSSSEKVHVPLAKKMRWNSVKNCCQPRTANTARPMMMTSVTIEPAKRPRRIPPVLRLRRYRMAMMLRTMSKSPAPKADRMTSFTSAICETSLSVKSLSPSRLTKPPPGSAAGPVTEVINRV